MRTIENEIVAVKQMRSSLYLFAKRAIRKATAFHYFSSSCAILFKQIWVVPPPIDQPLTSL
jgi:hypothetical protein